MQIQLGERENHANHEERGKWMVEMVVVRKRGWKVRVRREKMFLIFFCV